MGKSQELQTDELIFSQFNPMKKFLRENSKRNIIDGSAIEKLKLIEEKATIKESEAEELVKIRFNCEVIGWDICFQNDELCYEFEIMKDNNISEVRVSAETGKILAE